jgi:hypothetical protein
VAIGLVFVYLLMSLICSAANEIIESYLKNRATDLERGIRELFNQEGSGDLVAKFYNHPLISGLFRGVYGRGDGKEVSLGDYLKPTNLPSYIPARNFSYALIDLLLHPPTEGEGAPARDDSAQAGGVAVGASPLPASMDAVRLAIRRNMGGTEVGRALRTLAEQSGDSLEALRENVEAWFNGSMDRVSGWYKRRTKWIILLLGLVLTVLLNVNTITIARRLSTDATLRNMIVAQAEARAGRPDAQAGSFEENKNELQGLGLPLGWPSGIVFFPSPFNLWDHFLLPIIGWLLTAAAVSLGAPFWFDMLNKLMVVRATVKPHEKSPEEASEDRQAPPGPTLISTTTPGPAGAGASAAGGRVGAVGSGAALLAAESGEAVTPEPELAAPPDPEDNESHLDGCDVDVVEVTPDEDLPPTEGGVA